jgi:uncharacterized protein DUF4288
MSAVRKSSGRKRRRFAAKLLFQFRVVVDGKSDKRRLCEERIILIDASTAQDAHTRAIARGRAAQHHYKNGAGNPVHFEFIGLLDLLRLGVECEPDEVWYDIKTMLTPKERAKSLLPPKRKLNALYWAKSWRGRES